MGYLQAPNPYPPEVEEVRQRVRAACLANGVAFLDVATPEDVCREDRRGRARDCRPSRGDGAGGACAYEADDAGLGRVAAMYTDVVSPGCANCIRLSGWRQTLRLYTDGADCPTISFEEWSGRMSEADILRIDGQAGRAV